MKKTVDPAAIQILQDEDKSIAVMLDAAKWLEETGKDPSKWWQAQNMNHDFLSLHVEVDEFYVAMVDGEPAASVVLQDNERNQSWKSIDTDTKRIALYIHWLCVHRAFAGMGLPKVLIDFVEDEAKKRKFSFLRLDTAASRMKLRDMYENLGFHLVGIDGETAFYQKEL